MHQHTVQNDQSFDSNRKFALAYDSSGGSGTRSYAWVLRTLGTILDQQRFCDFDLRIEDDTCEVNGIVERCDLKRPPLLDQIRGLFGNSSEFSGTNAKTITRELSFSMAEIDAMETKVQEQRQKPSKMPDPCCLSQILRGVGCYLDKRIGSKLVDVARTGRWVTIAYRMADGRLERTQKDMEYFYNYAVKMYLRRSSREELPPLSDPTLIVTWEERQKTHKLYQLTK